MKSPKAALVFAFFSVLSPPLSATASVQVFDHAAEASPIISFIQHARKSIDIEIYEMKSRRVQAALLQAASQGVQVRILMEPTPVGSKCPIFGNATPGSTPLGDAACEDLMLFKAALERSRGKILPFRKELCGAGSAGGVTENRSCFQHGKIAIADGREAILSTGNFSSVDLCDLAEKPAFCQQDYTLLIRSAPVIGVLQIAFDFDWAGIPNDLPRSLPRYSLETVTVSPFSMDPITDFIRSARKSIEIEEQYLNDPKMNAELINAATRGVAVKILVSSFCAFGRPSDSAQARIAAYFTAFENAGIQALTFPSSILVNGRPGYLHSKMILVDGAEAWVGSVNGSTQSLTVNREYGLFFKDLPAVEKLRKSFARNFQHPNTQTWQESLKCQKDKYRL